MATSLDEAVEQLFVGWTPAPPASDHVSYDNSADRHFHRKRQLTANDKSAQSASPQTEAAPSGKLNFDAQSADRQATGNEWEDWESPFGSSAASPEACSGPCTDQAQSAIVASAQQVHASASAQDTAQSSAAPERQNMVKSAHPDLHDRSANECSFAQQASLMHKLPFTLQDCVVSSMIGHWASACCHAYFVPL